MKKRSTGGLAWIFALEGRGSETPAPGGDPSKNTPAGGGEGNKPEFVTREDFNGVAGKIRGFEQTLKTLNEGALTIEKLVEVGLLEKGEDGKIRRPGATPAATPKPKPGDQPKPDDGVSELRSELKKLQDTLRLKDEEIANERKSAEALSKKQAIVASLNKANAYNAERDFKHLTEQVVKNANGVYVVKGKDKYGSETEIPLDEAVEAFLKDNPELRKATATPGSDGRGGSGTNIPSGAKVIPYETWSNMEFMVANREKFDKGEYVRGPRPRQ